MALTIKPHGHVSRIVNEKLREGTSIVDLLTDYRTPCYVFNARKSRFGYDRIATNIGITLSDGNLTSFIFDESNLDESYMVKYISEVQKILRTPQYISPINSEKQLPKSFFSQISVKGDYNDILLEFEGRGWEIVRPEANSDGWRLNALVLKEMMDGHRKNYGRVRKEALAFYQSQS